MSSNKIIKDEKIFNNLIQSINKPSEAELMKESFRQNNNIQVNTLNTHLTFKGFEGKCLGFSGQVAKINGGRGFFDMGRRA